MLAKQIFLNRTNKKRCEKNLPLQIFKILCIFGSEKGGLRAALPDQLCRILKFHMVINILKRNGNSLGANSYQKFAFFELP